MDPKKKSVKMYKTITHAQHPNRIIAYRNLLLLGSKAKKAYRTGDLIQQGFKNEV